MKGSLGVLALAELGLGVACFPAAVRFPEFDSVEELPEAVPTARTIIIFPQPGQATFLPVASGGIFSNFPHEHVKTVTGAPCRKQIVISPQVDSNQLRKRVGEPSTRLGVFREILAGTNRSCAGGR